MPEAHVTVFHLFDVADVIQLPMVRSQIESASTARLKTRPSTPSYLQYQEPPVTVDGATVGVAELDGYRVRFKVFDYGVVSVALTRTLQGDWNVLVHESAALQDGKGLADQAERLCRQLMALIQPALTRAHARLLAEDYVVIGMTPQPDMRTGTEVLERHGPELAQILRGEREPLSDQERHEALRHRLSYYATDMTITTWSSAFVYDTEEGMQGSLEILEFANSQLLEFRYYDGLLDTELSALYNRLQAGRWNSWASRRYSRAARQVQALFIDVNELTDRTENALKIAGDVYAARLFNMTAARLGLDQWKANVRDKLKTLDDIYRFAVEHTSIARGELLELTIVLLIVFEIVLLFVGVS